MGYWSDTARREALKKSKQINTCDYVLINHEQADMVHVKNLESGTVKQYSCSDKTREEVWEQINTDCGTGKKIYINGNYTNDKIIKI